LSQKYGVSCAFSGVSKLPKITTIARNWANVGNIPVFGRRGPETRFDLHRAVFGAVLFNVSRAAPDLLSVEKMG